MLALTVIPRQTGSAELTEVAEPHPSEGAVLVTTLAVGICGTDREILGGRYGSAAPERQRLILGHESLGQVAIPSTVSKSATASAPSAFASSRNLRCAWIARLRESGVLLEPASVVAKAWDHIEHIGRRSRSWRPRRVLVTGAGPVGLLAALMARQRDCDLHVYDRDRGDAKRNLVAELGGEYHLRFPDTRALRADVVIECTGAAEVVAAAIGHNAAGGIVCLAGLSSGVHRIAYDFSALNRNMVLENDVVFGSVNANRRHYDRAAVALSQADPRWLGAIITRRTALTDWPRAVERRADDIKVVIDFTL